MLQTAGDRLSPRQVDSYVIHHALEELDPFRA